MAIWNDPLDQLIADLERAVPPAAAKAPLFDLLPFEDVCVWVQWLLCRDPAHKARLAEDRQVKRAQAYYDRLALARSSEPR
jgi:hypothetical protein